MPQILPCFCIFMQLFARVFLLRAVLLGTLFSVCLLSDNVNGQVAPGQGQESSATSSNGIPVTGGEAASGRSAAPVQRTPLDTIVLFDEATGKKVLVLAGNWPLEELDEFNSFLLRNQREPIPAFTIHQITAKGNIVGNCVETVVRFVITTPNDQTVRIPLGLKEGVFPSSPDEDVSRKNGKESPLPYRYTGPGVFDLIVNPQDGQYVALIRHRNSVKKGGEQSPDPVKIVEDLPEHLLPSIDEKPSEPKPAPLGQEKKRSKETATEQRHELMLTLWFPLTKLGEDDYRLSISFPKGVSSLFQLSVPMVGAAAAVSQGALLDTFEPNDGKTTLFTVRGLKSNFDISWRKKKSDRFEDRPVLNVQDATIIARLENKATFYDAVLPVSSPTGFDRILVRLPQDAVLDREGADSLAPSGDYSLRELSMEEKASLKTGRDNIPRPDSPVYEVLFSHKTNSQVVRLRAVQSNSSEKPGALRDIGGFEILGAERQTGFLSVGIPDEMRPNWKPVRGLRRVDLPTAPVQEGIDARFEFFLQPFLLRAQIVLPQTRINVKPEYQVQVNKGQLILTAKFSFVIHGSKTDKLQLAFPDWRWIDIGPDNIVDLNGVVKDSVSNLLTIPLRAPFDGSFEIELKAFQPISPDEKAKQRLTVRLPSPVTQDGWIEPASVVILPDDNVELIPVDTETVSPVVEPEKSSSETPSETTTPQRTIGLARKSRRTLPIRIDIPPRQQDPLVYQTESSFPVFVADLLYHRQAISVSVQHHVKLLEPENQVTTNLNYTVAYEPVDKLVLLIPKSVDETGRWSVSLGEKILEARDVPLNADEESAEKWVKKRISLPEARIDKIPLTVRYSIPPILVERNITTASPVPFVRPVEADVSGFDVQVAVPSGFHVELHGDGDGLWKSVDVPLHGDTASRQPYRFVGFSSPTVQDKISLLVSVEERETLGTTVIEKAWLQTWLTDNVRMDRGLYLLTSDRESVTLWLPVFAAKGIRILLDGKPISVRPSPKGELIVPLTRDQQFRPLLLDIWYQFSEDLPHGLVQMELPHFDQGTVVRCVYWQLILPPYRHLINVPSNWTPEYTWKWNGLFWGRTPTFRMDSIGFPDDPSNAPPTESSQYLFGSIHPSPSTSFYVLNRSWIVLLSSGLSLLVGLMLIYFPRCRYAGSLFGIAIALLATIFYRPAPVLLALQASSLGVFLALGASYFYRILNRGDQWRTPTRQSPWTPVAAESVAPPSEVYSVIVDESDSKKDAPDSKQ